MGQLATPLAAQYRTTDGVLPFALTGVTNEVATTRIRDGQGPSISWTLGHLLHFRHHALGLLGGPKEDSFASFANSSATDGSDYPDVVELKASLGKVGAQLQERLATITDEQLGQPLPVAPVRMARRPSSTRWSSSRGTRRITSVRSGPSARRWGYDRPPSWSWKLAGASHEGRVGRLGGARRP